MFFYAKYQNPYPKINTPCQGWYKAKALDRVCYAIFGGFGLPSGRCPRLRQTSKETRIKKSPDGVPLTALFWRCPGLPSPLPPSGGGGLYGKGVLLR